MLRNFLFLCFVLLFLDLNAQLSNRKVDFIIPTFLGSEQRNYYGEGSPDSLSIIWQLNLGEGKTVISRRLGSRIWAGAGWTGQPLLIEEDSTLYLIQGAYDHHLKKIKAATGEIVWQYKFDDVIKGTGTIYENPFAKDSTDQYMIFQGSRLGVGNYLDSDHIPSYRAISYLTGEELWRLDVKWDASYSRDVDASCLVIKDTIYIGLENGLLTSMNPLADSARVIDSMLQPQIIKEVKLYEKQDVIDHDKNVVTESSVARLNDHLYVAAGSGHVYGYNLKSKEIVWDFFIGSDMDGTVAVTKDSMLLVTVEKQYIKGKGGVYKLNPALPSDEAVVWFHATGNTDYGGWEGGIIGSCGINDRYITDSNTSLAAFTALDGHLYVVDHLNLSKNKNLGTDSITSYMKPKQLFKFETGPAIATPIFTKDRLIVASYHGLYLFSYDSEYNFELLDKFEAEFEATPIVWDDKVFIASRNGYLYCFGTINKE